jgi:hypothetical protein
MPAWADGDFELVAADNAFTDGSVELTQECNDNEADH